MTSIKRLKEGATMFADLIEAVPAAFAIGSYAADESGHGLGGGNNGVDNPAAVAFCVIGGVAAAAECSTADATTFLDPFCGDMSPESFNNNRGRLEVIKMLRVAAA